jgi:hypothetical protein
MVLTALAVLLALLRAMLLGKVGDTVADAVGALRQVRLAVRHLRFDLLTKSSLARRRRRATGGPHGERRRQRDRRGLAFYAGGERGLESGSSCHESNDLPIFRCSAVLLSCAV